MHPRGAPRPHLESGGASWLSDCGRNLDVAIARILHPLVETAVTPDGRARLERLRAAGLFDARHEWERLPAP